MTLPELFANPPVPGTPAPLGTLAAPITTAPAQGTVESWPLSAAAPASLRATTGQFRVLIDSEIMIVAASASGASPWSFTRGAEGTVPATHASGAAVNHVLTQGAMQTLAQAGADGLLGTPGQGGTQLTGSVVSRSVVSTGALVSPLAVAATLKDTWVTGDGSNPAVMTTDLAVTTTGPAGSMIGLFLKQDSTGGHGLTVNGVALLVPSAPNAAFTIYVYSADGVPANTMILPVGGVGPTGPVGPTGYWGDGSDGAVTLDGTTAFAGATLSTGTYTLTRDVLATTLVINAAVKTNGYALFARVSITGSVAGSLDMSGTNGGANGTAGAISGVNGASRFLTVAGGAGNTGAGTNGGQGGVGMAAAGSGGLGSGGAGGSAITPVLSGATWMFRSPVPVLAGAIATGGTSRFFNGAPGGAGGAGDGTNKGGAGGTGGGFILLVSPTINFAGAITVNGGNGGTPTTGNCGGGGAAAGGTIIAFTTSAWTVGSTSVLAGTRGSGVGTGANGGTAGNGLVLNVVLA